MAFALNRLEVWWARSPQTLLKLLQAMQQHALREQGDLGEALRWTMFTFAGVALSSSEEDLRNVFAESMVYWIRHGDGESVHYACCCLSRCKSSLGPLDDACRDALLLRRDFLTLSYEHLHARAQAGLDRFCPGWRDLRA